MQTPPKLTDLQQLAFVTASQLQRRPGVDAVFVLIVSKESNDFGTALVAPAVGIDIMFATGVEALVQIRKQAVANAVPMPPDPEPAAPAAPPIPEA